MSDYGIKVSQPNESVYSDDLADILMTTGYNFAKIDPTKQNTLATVNFTFLTNPTVNTITKWYSMPYPYTYDPMRWEIWWDMQGPSGALIQSTVAIGTYFSNTSPTYFSLFTKLNSSNSALDFYVYSNEVLGSAPDLTGVTGTWSTYIFVDELAVT